MQVRVDEYTISPGDAGIKQTVQHMARLITEGARHPWVRAAAEAATLGIAPDQPPDRRQWEECLALREYVAAVWSFENDPPHVERLWAPDTQLGLIDRWGAMRADCDDAAILLGSLGRALGLDVRIICVGFLTADAPFTHTWGELRPASGRSARWLEGDVTRAMQAMPVDRLTRVARLNIPP